MKRADLHMHTTYSDGSYTLNEVVGFAKEKGLNYISITDHDTLVGSLKAYKELNGTDLKIIIGLELSSDNNGESIHVLGYFKNDTNLKGLDSYLEEQRKLRRVRANKIKEALYKYFNIDLDMSFIEKLYSVTRGSIANEIIKQGYPYTKEEIFAKMIGEGCPAYYPSTKLNTIDAVKLIHEYGGLAVLAHPCLIKHNDVSELLSYGFDGIEAIYPKNKENDEERFRKLAKKYNIFVTAGSDFHSFNDEKHGNIGDVSLTNMDLEIFLNKLEVK